LLVLFLFQSGLTEAVRKSTTSIEMAEEEIVNFVKKYTVPGQSILSGNSIGKINDSYCDTCLNLFNIYTIALLMSPQSKSFAGDGIQKF